MGDCLTIAAANNFLAKDALRIQGRIIDALKINSPWINAIDRGTFRSGISDSQRSVIQEAVPPVVSQANPGWFSWNCNITPSTIQTGSTEYTYTPELVRQKSAKICVTQAFSSFENALCSNETSIVDHVQTMWNAWIRSRLYQQSATKIVANSTATSLQALTTNGFATLFKPGVTPNSGLTFQFLKVIANYLTHVLLAGDEYKFGEGNMKHFRLISDETTIDNIRNEMGATAGFGGVRGDLQFLASSGKKEYIDQLVNFHWDGPYRGLAFAVDQSILRANQVNPDGSVNLVEPFLTANATNGVKRIPNPQWLAAQYQISFLFAKGSFERQIPEEFLGKCMSKWDKQYWGGDVQWHNQKDNDCNIFGDTGFFIYQLAAAMRPERPEFVIPILHQRCQDNLGLTACTGQYYQSA